MNKVSRDSMRRRFITFEGSDATGKSTQMQLLQRYLVARGHDVVVTREPGGTPMGERIRTLLLDCDGMSPEAEALMFVADRDLHVRQVIEPALKRGSVVLCDRYSDSTYAYQGYGLGVDLDWLRSLHQRTAAGLVPGLTFLFVMPPDRSLRPTDHTVIERRSREFHQRVRDGYLELAAAEPERFSVIEVDSDARTIQRRVRERIRLLLVRSARLSTRGVQP